MKSIAPSLGQRTDVVVLKPHEPTQWQLPEIDQGTHELSSIHVTVPDSLRSAIKYDEDTQTFTFKGLASYSSLANKNYLIKVVLESSEEEVEFTLFMMIQV